MTLLFLKTSLALWKRRVTERTKLLATAKQDVEEARLKDTHPRQALVDRLTLREKQLKEAVDNVALREKQIAEKKTGRVRRPFEQIVRSVSNQSSRNGVKVTLIVLHDTEGGNLPGIADLKGLGDWFNNPAAQASAHVGVDADGNSAQFVPDTNKAWHVAAYNSKSLGVEQVGFATQKAWPDAQLKKTAQYVAYWSKKYRIPLVHNTENGVCMHSDLGVAGGGHHDPGPAYPMDKVLNLARDFARNGW